MDLTNLTAKVKGFQRRTTQKVLQQMGMADKTEDESPAFQNFLALGSFASQLKATVQATDTSLEKSCTAQSHLAGQIQSYLISELSGDGELPPGELNDFFGANENMRAHANTLQDASEKFYAACSEIGNNALQAIVGQLDDLVLKPIQRDEDLGVVTKDLVEEKKKATLDFDSYRRMASNATSQSEHEKAEAKVRAARDRYEEANRRLAEHINHRNQMRCKLLVHGILTAMQQYTNYYLHAVDILRETANTIKPLLAVYQLNEQQLHNIVNLQAQPPRQDPNRAKSPTGGPPGKVTADHLFNEYESQNRGGRPSAPQGRGGVASPQPNSNLDDMMMNNLNLKKPAAPQQAQKNVPMNQLNNNGSTRTPPPTHHVNSPQPQHSNHHLNQQHSNSPHIPRHEPPSHAPPQPTPSQPTPPPQSAAPPTQPFVDLLGGESPMSAASFSSAEQPKKQGDILVNLMDPSPSQSKNLFDSNDLIFGGSGFAPAGMQVPPPMQPTTNDPFAAAFGPSASANSAKQPNNDFDMFINPQKTNPPSGTSKPAASSFSPQPQQPQPTPKSNDPFGDSLFGNPSPHTPPAGRAPTGAAGFGSAPPGYGQNPGFGGQPGGFGAQSGFGGPAGGFGGQPGFGAAPQAKPAPTPAASSSSPSAEDQGELSPALEAKISNWANRGGRASNMRALLSSLHEVIWVDSGWDAMSLTDLITTTQVKKAYRRANLIVHPDKVQGAVIEHKLIAKRIFEALRVANETFKDEPS